MSSSECCLQLLFPFSARSISLGQSLTARPGVDGLFYNPASLAGIGKGEFLTRIHHKTTFVGQDIAVTLAYDAGLIGSFGLTYALIDQGETEATSDIGEVTGSLAVRFHQLIASYAIPVTAGLRAGVSYKLFYGGQFCSWGLCNDNTASGFTQLVDLGVQLRPPFLHSLELGAAITQFGFALQEKNAPQADPTPARLRFGAAYELLHHVRADSAVEAWVSFDVVDRMREPAKPIAGFGLELSFDRLVHFRAGYSGSGDALTLGGGGLGVGVHYSRYSIDVARVFTRSEVDTGGEPFLVSIGITF